MSLVTHLTIKGALRRPGRGTLDAIEVFILDYGAGRGLLTINCWGLAWSAYWGAMGSTVGKFVARTDPDYIANCLLRGRDQQFATLKRFQRREREYVEDIVRAVKAALTTTKAP